MSRRSETRGLWFAICLCFSAKAIFVKLAYPYGVAPVTLLALRMAFSRCSCSGVPSLRTTRCR